MSALAPFVRVFKAVGDAFSTAAEDKTLEKVSRETLVGISVAFHDAGIALQQQIAQDLSRTGPLEPRPTEEDK